MARQELVFSTTAQSGVVTESDPIFTAHPAFNITSSNITDWSQAFAWGDHSTQGYLTSFSETDPVFSAHVASGITSTNISNWNTAFGWGNHAGLYSLLGHTHAWADITGKPSFHAVATSGDYNDLSNKPTIPTNNNTLTNGAGYITSASLTWANITGKPTIPTSADYIQNQVASIQTAGFKINGPGIIDRTVTGSAVPAYPTDSIASANFYTINGNPTLNYNFAQSNRLLIQSAPAATGYQSAAMRNNLYLFSVVNTTSGDHIWSAMTNRLDVHGTSNVANLVNTFIQTQISNTASITNLYNVYIPALIGTGIANVANNWGIYQVATTSKNHFGGSVLIGTTVDGGYKLNVVGDVNYSTAGSTQSTVFGFSSGTSGRIVSNSAGMYIRSDAGRELNFGSNGNNNRLIITTTGNVLMGPTTDGGFKLDVTGTTRLNGVVTLSSVANETVDPDKILVLSSGIVKYMTKSQLGIGTGGITTETDPVFLAHAAYGITSTNISNWSTAYSWGNHASAGYLTSFTETDPIFVAHAAYNVTNTKISNWDAAYGWGNHASAGYLTSFTETDPVFVAHVANSITSTNISNWNTAYGWGNHASAGYLTSFTETDPVFLAHAAFNVTNTKISNWDTAFGWGNHATQGYLTSNAHTHGIANAAGTQQFTFGIGDNIRIEGTGNASVSFDAATRKITINATAGSGADGNNYPSTVTFGTSTGVITIARDGLADISTVSLDGRYYTETEIANFFSGSSAITGYSKSNWDTAYGWGNHASAGYLTSFTETDPVFVAHASYGITSTNISNWSTAYGWGNHASAGYLTSATAATTYQPLDGDLTSIAGLAGTSGFLKKTGANTWTLDTATYLTSLSHNHGVANSAGTQQFTFGVNDNVRFVGAGNTSVSFTSGTKTVTITSTGITTESDPVFVAHAAYGITSTNISNWNTAFGWGNHSTQGYLTSNAHTHGVANATGTQQFTFGVGDNIRFEGTGNASVTYDAATKKIIINAAAGSGADGNNYPTGLTFVDTTGKVHLSRDGMSTLETVSLDARYYTETEIGNFFSGSTAITGYSKTNWDSAYGWGNHASAGYLTTATAASTYQPLDGDLTAIAALSGSNGFLKKTGTNTWTIDTSTYSLSSHTHAWGDITGKPTTFTPSSHNHAASEITSGTFGSARFAGTATNGYVLKIVSGVPTWDVDATGGGGAETDPVFLAHAAYGITSTNISNWTTAYGWGNHASAGYLSTATAASTYQPLDGDLTAIAGLAGTSGFLKKTGANTWTLDTATYAASTHTHATSDITSGTFVAARFAGTATNGFVLKLVSGVPTWSADTDTDTDTNNYPTGLSFIDTTGKIYISRNGLATLETVSLDTRYYTEAEIAAFFGGSVAITGYNKSNWDTAYGWGNHASAGYLTSATAASTYQPLDGDLTAIAALAGTSGFLKKTGANTWTLDTATYAASTHSHAASDITSGTFGSARFAGTATNGYVLKIVSGVPTWDVDATGSGGDGNNYTTGITFTAGTGVISISRDGLSNLSTTSLDGRYYTETEIANFFSGSTAITGYSKSNWDTAYGWGNHASAGYLSTATAASTYQPLDGDLTAIAALAGTSGFLKKTGTNTWTLDTATYITSASLTWTNITGKPTFATVATSGSYNDLTNKPTIFTGSGTTNSLAKWSSSTNLTSSLMWDNGTNFGIGNAPGGGVSARFSIEGHGNTSATYSWYCIDSSSVGIGFLDNDGNLSVAGNVTAAYSFSDARLKKNVETLDQKEVAEKLMRLNPVSYQWNDEVNKRTEVGFIAQEVEQVFPELVTEATRFDGMVYKRVDYEKATALLLAGYKELVDEIKQLKNK